MAMTWQQWTEIVARVNASWPDRQIEPVTAREWYAELDQADPAMVWAAVRRLRVAQHWRPSLAEVCAEVTRQRHQAAEQARSSLLRLSLEGRGVPPSPAVKRALRLLLRGTPRPDQSEGA